MMSNGFATSTLIIGIILATSLLGGGYYLVSSQSLSNGTNSENGTAVIENMGEPEASPTSQPSQTPSNNFSTTFKGEIVCLPHKNTENETFECSYGLLGEDKKYYGLENLNQADLVSGKIAVGTKVNIKGVLKGALRDSKEDQTYDIQGVIVIQSLTKL